VRGGGTGAPERAFAPAQGESARPNGRWRAPGGSRGEPAAARRPGALLYLREGHDAAGGRQLIAVALRARAPATNSNSTTGPSARRSSSPRGPTIRCVRAPDAVRGPRQPLRFYAGRPDPANPSAFTVPYELDGSPGTLRGRLTGDGSIALDFESGPAKSR
jgi:hypothetical protein